MIQNPSVVGSGSVETATIQVDVDRLSSPDYGIYYVSPDGTSSFKDLANAPFSIQVKNGSFVLPIVSFDMGQDFLSGGLSVIQGTEGYSAVAGYTQYLIYVYGNGAISGPI
jgi:hypothetical protein|nr:MAG TPA: hypothetical protein [Caudoviricetes sp.]